MYKHKGLFVMKNKINNLLVGGRKLALLALLAASSATFGQNNINYGVVTAKQGNDVFLKSLDGKDTFVMSFDMAFDDANTKNIYMNMNVGDMVCFCDNTHYDKHVVIPSKVKKVNNRTYTEYFIKSINGTFCELLPDLVGKNKTKSISKNIVYQACNDSIQR